MTEENHLAKYVPEVAKQKERDNRKPKEKKHDPSAEKEELKFKFFNETDHKTIRDDLVRELNVIADKYIVNHIDLDECVGYNGKWSDRDWSWKATFFIKYLEQYEDTVDYEIVPHYRFWLDWTISQCSIMVWNLVQKTETVNYILSGTIPKTNLSRKRGRDSINVVSDHLADIEVRAFEEKFK